MRIVVAVDGAHGERLVAELTGEGHVAELVPALQPARAAEAAALGASEDTAPSGDVLVLAVTRSTLTPALVSSCDRRGMRIVALADDDEADRLAAAAGLGEALPLDAAGWRVADAIAAPSPLPAPPSPRARGAGLTVWGPPGAPGRSTVAVALAAELARGGRSVALVDADAHAPSLALALGLADEGPGFPAACRQSDRGGLDAAELARISAPLGLSDGAVHVLTGINRPARWPELTAARVGAALDACREWCDYTVVDTAAPLESDEEIVSDMDGPRRNAATLAALRAADLVVAVLSADPLGAARFVRGSADLRAVVGAAPVAVAANRLRPGALGIDPRGQVRRTLDRFAGIADVAFLPLDPRSADAAMLAARPLSEVAPRSPFTLAVRRFAGEVVLPALGAAVTRPADETSPDRRAPRRRAPRVVSRTRRSA
jgi:MinD-like ATPase involved in chromosome partitioning or flagellar assembly